MELVWAFDITCVRNFQSFWLAAVQFPCLKEKRREYAIWQGSFIGDKKPRQVVCWRHKTRQLPRKMGMAWHQRLTKVPHRPDEKFLWRESLAPSVHAPPPPYLPPAAASSPQPQPLPNSSPSPTASRPSPWPLPTVPPPPTPSRSRPRRSPRSRPCSRSRSSPTRQSCLPAAPPSPPATISRGTRFFAARISKMPSARVSRMWTCGLTVCLSFDVSVRRRWWSRRVGKRWCPLISASPSRRAPTRASVSDFCFPFLSSASRLLPPLELFDEMFCPVCSLQLRGLGWR
jgi:hypothetical protein